MIVLFDSVRNTTLKVASHAATVLGCRARSVDSKPIPHEFNIIFSPTYGDEELPPMMEDYILGLSARNKHFAICELGNYYGYDDYTFGAAIIIRRQLLLLGWKEVFNSLSLDSYPHVNLDELNIWIGELNEMYKRNYISQ